MEKSKSKKKRRAEKPALNVTGQLAMPREILPWERDLLVVLVEAVDGSAEQEEHAYIEVSS
jgi:hypothetical protein